MSRRAAAAPSAKLARPSWKGAYVSSRKVDGSLYFVTNKGLAYSPALRLNQSRPAAGTDTLSSLSKQLPVYKDSAAGNDFIPVGYDSIRYFPDSLKSTYLMIGGLNLDQPGQSMTVQSYLGSGSEVYASRKHLYVVSPEYAAASVQPLDTSAPQRRIASFREENSAIYKFGLDEGAIRYIGRGSVPGHAVNSFAMDESNGYFRIATTRRQWNEGGGMSMSSQMYVLDESLQTAGKIENIAPGEQIYSVRYTGDRAYMVTFRTVDPLFVIDLKEPQAPKIVGKLKIPGYSNYLHPYDENHIIGFGKDTVEISNESSSGAAPDNSFNSSSVFYQGMKMALFDISDVEHPKELFVERIGDRGTESELLNNHKALLFSKDQGLLAFPVTVRENAANGSAAAGTKQVQASQYGSFTFQGAYVYKLDLTEGFKLQGKITHLTSEDYDKSGELGSAPQRSIHRVLSIGDTLYTASEQMLKATELRSFQEVGAVTLP
ncbi:beta-propeller domain-containing protein [Paenibacillus sp. TAB 01]|uniref:beta-propeller domain-containing protein n=1 Tax=Paenibacillus sp. TAB 01 TaxID=3368988 RepID=UPI003750418B